MDLAQNEFAVRDQNNNAGEKYVEVQFVSFLFLVTQVVAYYNNYFYYNYYLTLYSLISVCIFSIHFSINFPMC